MHQRSLKALLVVCGAGLWMSCSSSTAPKPTVAGTWHVTLGAMSRGTITPASFDAVVTQSGSTYTVSIPTLTWSVGPVVFGGAAGISSYSDTTKWGVFKGVTGGTGCGAVTVGGTLDASKSALSGVTVTAGDSTTTIGSTTVCVPQTTGSGTAAK